MPAQCVVIPFRSFRTKRQKNSHSLRKHFLLITRNKTKGSYLTGRSLANNSFFSLIIKFPAKIKGPVTYLWRDLASCKGRAISLPAETHKGLTWDQALFSFRFENYIPAGRTKRKESLIQTFNEMSAAHLFDWLTFAESANQNYFRYLFF